MTKDQKDARAAAIKAINDAFPQLSTADAAKLQDKLYAISVRATHNAVQLCNVADWQDQREALRADVAKVVAKFGVPLSVELGGDPRGFVMKLHLPTGAYNTWGGSESGWGLGPL